MKSKIVTHNLFYPTLIFFIWLITYLISSYFLNQNVEWDEAKYMAIAKGIAENLDFSSRATTVQGLLKYGFPQNTTHYPLHSIYIAIFFKLFGASTKVAFFSTWFSALITCVFIYFIMLLLVENKSFSFLTSMLFLFLPRIINQCNSVMMEIPGCALISVLTYFIFRSILKEKLNPIFLSFASLLLYFYKSLFIGAVIGITSLIYLARNVKKNILISFLLYLITFFLVYIIFTKFIFLPLAPWMDFSLSQQGVYGAYADFDGGFLKDPLNNSINSLKLLWQIITSGYFPSIPVDLDEKTITGCYVTSPIWLETGLYFLALFYVIAFTFFSRKKLARIQKLFIWFSLISILSFNIIFNILIETNLGPRCRYNLIYVPLLLISFATLVWINRDCIKKEYRNSSIFILVTFVLFVYIPVYSAGSKIMSWNKKLMYESAMKNTEIVRKYINNSNPMFIYFVRGTFVAWNLYPTREIFMEANSDVIKRLNLFLLKPVEYLFIGINDSIFKENRELILKGQPIIDNWYTFLGVDVANNVVVYKLDQRFYEPKK